MLEESKEQKRQQIINYYLNALKIGYLPTEKDLKKEFSMFLGSYFPGRMAELKRVTGTEDVKLPTKRLQEIRAEKAKDIRDYIKENPRANYEEVAKAVGHPEWYISGGINQVRIEQGIAPKHKKITPEIRKETEEKIISYAKDFYEKTGCRPTSREINKHLGVSHFIYLKMGEILQRAVIPENALTKGDKENEKQKEATIEKIINYCKQVRERNGYVPTRCEVERDLKLDIRTYTKDSFKEILSKANVSGVMKFQREFIEKRQKKLNDIEECVKQYPDISYRGIKQVLRINIANYFPEGLNKLKEKIRKRKEILEYYIQNLGSEEIEYELGSIKNIKYCGFKDLEDIKTEALKSIKNSHSLGGFIITPKILIKALKNHYDGIAEEEASKTANHTLNFFDPNSNRIIDNVLEPEDRDNFYTLEKEGILIRYLGDEAILLPNGRLWDIYYWELNKKRIFELALNSKKEEIKKEEDYSIYNTVSEEVWKRDKNAQKSER